MTYTVVKAAGKPVGGIMSMPPGAEELPPNWGAFVTVNDVDSVAANAQQLGGKLCWNQRTSRTSDVFASSRTGRAR